MAERLKASVLKTDDPSGSVGSNPTPSARECRTMQNQMTLNEALAVVHFMHEGHHAELLKNGRLTADEKMAYDHALYVIRESALDVLRRAEAALQAPQRVKRQSAQALWSR